ncbi:MAG: AMP-binding protein, partial [Solirubrobacteraceae bacterium]
HYEVLLDAIVRDPDVEIARLPLLPASEQARILAASCPPADAPARDVMAAFEAQVARTPEAIAVRCGAEALTYRTLADQADRIAGRLRAAGVEPDRVVAIVMERGIAYLASVLGVLKAGGAWLVLDPQQPSARRARMLEEIEPCAVLATEPFVADAREALDAARSIAHLIAVDEHTTAAGIDDATGAAGVRGSSVAYAIFTSGTTGVPKGALVQRRSLDHHLQAFARQLALSPGDRIAQHAPHNFDATIWQFLAPLTAGAEVHIVPDDEAGDPDRLYRALCEQRITVIDVVPAVLEALLVAARSQPAPPCLRRVVVGGDVLPVELARRWLARFPEIPLVNAYGPSEATDVTTVYD